MERHLITSILEREYDQNAPRIKLSQSIIIESTTQMEDKPVEQKKQNQCYLSLINIEKRNEPIGSYFKKVLSQNQNKSIGSSIHEKEFMELSDDEFVKKYETDPIFQLNIDNKVKKRRRKSLMVRIDSSQNQQQSEQNDRIPTTLKKMMDNQNTNNEKLLRRYQKLIQSKK